jgi:hypothetical protein
MVRPWLRSSPSHSRDRGCQGGCSLALFFAMIGVVAVAVNGVRAQRRVQIIMTSIFVAGLLALIEEVSTLSVISSRPSTPFSLRRIKDVDARHRAGHDENQISFTKLRRSDDHTGSPDPSHSAN